MTQDSVNPARRRFLAQVSALSALGLMPSAVFAAADQPAKDMWLSATGDSAESYGLSWYRDGSVQSLASGFRGHGCAWHPAHADQAVLVGRRPGRECLLADLNTGAELRRWQTEPGYHLNGHALYSADGLLLFVAESADGTEAGSIAVYDAVLGHLLTRWSSHGTEPHEIRLSPDGSQLIIAHGGLQKDSKGQLTNRAQMQSDLTLLDARTGDLVARFSCPVATASLRHIDVAADGSVAIAAQIQDERFTPLAYLWRPGMESLTALEAPAALITHCHNYMGSVAICNASRSVGFTSPKGDLALFWNLDDGSFKGYHRFHDVCGLTVDQQQQTFVLSNSSGWLRQIRSSDLSPLEERWQQFDRRWDNHLLGIPG